jgi:hypothetical protein
MRFELTTLTLARLCSTPELRPLCGGGIYFDRAGAAREKMHPRRSFHPRLVAITSLAAKALAQDNPRDSHCPANRR